jgi:hypothetical protein
MHLIEIPSKNIKRYLPEDLSECDQRQYIEMSALIYLYHIGKINYEDFRIHALYKLLDMIPVKGYYDQDLKYSKVYELSILIDSFFEDNESGQKIIKQYYINNPLPKFKGSIFNYAGPADEFNDVTFGEYLAALEAFNDFNQTGENQYLYKLLAVLYRKSYFRKKRKFKSVSVDKRAYFFRHQHIGIVYGVYLLFASVQKYIATAKLFVEGNEIDLSVLFDGKSDKSTLPGIGMKGVLYSMAESGVFGNAADTKNVLLWEIFVRMYDIVKRNKDQEEETKKQERKTKNG